MDLAAMGPNAPQQLPFTSPPAVAPPTAPPSATASASPPAKRRRSSAALSGCCRTCRLRKVKCTGNPGNGGPCSNCARLELTCPFVTASGTGQTSDKISRVKPSNSHTEAGTLRKRAQRACRQCHSQKTKCSGDLPRCKRCDAAGLNCEYTPAKRKFANVPSDSQSTVDDPAAVAPPPPAAAATPSTSASASLPSKSDNSTSPSPIINGNKPERGGHFPLSININILTAQELLTRKNFILRHLDAYFEHLYWLPTMGFFHPEATYREVYEGTFDPPVATAMCAISSFFVNPGEASREFGMKCCDEIEFYIFQSLHKFSDRVLLPYALSLTFNFLNGSFAKVWQCFGIAARLMAGLQLNWDIPSRNKTFGQQELLRRLSWHYFCLDRFLAGGYEEYISVPADNMKICLPCNESAYWDDAPVIAERLTDKNAKCKGISLQGLNVRIVDLNHRIQRWTKKFVSRASLEPSKIMEDISNFQNELTRFHLSIPDDLRLSDQSVQKYMASPERAGFVYLHTHLSVAHIDLYRFALPGILDPNRNDILRRLPKDFVERSKKQAVGHALCTGRFCVAIQNEIARRRDNSKLSLAGDYTIPHMATQSLRVFLITMQHRIYDNLSEDTTAPLWRFQTPNEAHIRSLIEDGLFKVSEPWVPILMTCKQAHANNLAMFAEFNKTRKFADQKGTVGFVGPKVTGHPTRLPGPHYILENANYGVNEQEKRPQLPDTAVADGWFRGSEPSTAPPPRKPEPDTEYGPPGVPMLLAVARSSVGEPQVTDQNMYDIEKDTTVFMHDRMWLNGGMVDSQFLGATGGDGMSMLHVNPGDPSMMFAPPPPNTADATAAPPQFIPHQPAMFMNGYAAQYTDAGADSTAYMQQAGFG